MAAVARPFKSFSVQPKLGRYWFVSRPVKPLHNRRLEAGCSGAVSAPGAAVTDHYICYRKRKNVFPVPTVTVTLLRPLFTTCVPPTRVQPVEGKA